MTDLQLGLMLIGVLAVAGVLAYNRVQERSARRHAEQAFSSRHTDVLLDEPAGRTEPTLGNAHPVVAASRHDATIEAEAMPDSRVDYIVELALQRPIGGAMVLEPWASIERRFARRVLIAASDESAGWRRLHAGDAGACNAVRAALQMVTRAGVASDAEVLEFRSEVETLAAKLGATIAAPEMRQALEAARELDGVCAEADIQVALHVAGTMPSDSDIAAWDGQPFQVAQRDDDVTFTLDVPRVREIGRSYEAMARAARQLASRGGRLVDDRGRALDDQALAAIGAQLEPARRLLAERGIEPGSPLALRLFS